MTGCSKNLVLLKYFHLNIPTNIEEEQTNPKVNVGFTTKEEEMNLIDVIKPTNHNRFTVWVSSNEV
jgi:hypothetical protein